VQPEGRVPRRVGPPAHVVRQPAPVRQAEQRRAGERRRRGLALQRQQRGRDQHGQRRPAQARQHAAPARPHGGLWGRLARPAAVHLGGVLREPSEQAGSRPQCASPARAARYVAPRRHKADQLRWTCWCMNACTLCRRQQCTDSLLQKHGLSVREEPTHSTLCSVAHGVLCISASANNFPMAPAHYDAHLGGGSRRRRVSLELFHGVLGGSPAARAR